MQLSTLARRGAAGRAIAVFFFAALSACASSNWAVDGDVNVSEPTEIVPANGARLSVARSEEAKSSYPTISIKQIFAGREKQIATDAAPIVLPSDFRYLFDAEECSQTHVIKWRLTDRATGSVLMSQKSRDTALRLHLTTLGSFELKLACTATPLAHQKAWIITESIVFTVQPRILVTAAAVGKEGPEIDSRGAVFLEPNRPYRFQVNSCSTDRPFTWMMRRSGASEEQFPTQDGVVGVWQFADVGAFTLDVICSQTNRDGTVHEVRVALQFEVQNDLGVARSPRDFSQSDFLPVRRYVQGLRDVPGISVDEYCETLSSGGIFKRGTEVMVCRLRLYPRFALLFVEQPSGQLDARTELRDLNSIHATTKELGSFVDVIPFDNHILSVPCRTDLFASEECDGFLEAWLDKSDYQFGYYFGDQADSLESKNVQENLPEEAMIRLCHALRALFVLSVEKEYYIHSPLGFVARPGADQGRLILKRAPVAKLRGDVRSHARAPTFAAALSKQTSSIADTMANLCDGRR